MKTDLPPGINLIPNGIFGHETYGSTYLLEGKELILVDPGTSDALPNILDWFDKQSIHLSHLSGVLLTHIHLDHAGAAGHLAEEVDDLKVYVHQKGAAHLVDPSDLLDSVREATGDRFSDYGTLKPISENRIVPVEKKTVLDLGSRKITALPTPGHAPHHLAFYDQESRSLFPGDGAGLHLKGRLIPATPPPSFDLDKSLTSLKRMKELKPDFLLYPHFGPGSNPEKLLNEYGSILQNWVEEIEALYDDSKGKKRVIDRLLEKKSAWIVDGFTEEELAMNVNGALRYISWKRS